MFSIKFYVLILLNLTFITQIYSQSGLQGDITIRYIQRLPEIDYVKDSNNPDVDGWPVNGQQVTWRAHIKNWSSENYSSLSFGWLIDNSVVKTGTISLNAGEEITTDLSWSWTFSRHNIKLVLDPDNNYSDIYDSLSIYSNALSIGLYAEQSFYDSLNVLWEKWAEGEIEEWNKMLKNAKYQDTPDGVYDRFRIDKFTIVPDGTITDANIPTDTDYSVDIVYGFPVIFLNFVINSINNPDSRNSFIHELGHARYLLDLYGFDISSLDSIDISENGTKITGSQFLPVISYGKYQNVTVYNYFFTSYTGLMNKEWEYMDSYSAVVMNMMRGYRAINGNYNGSKLEGFFKNDIPQNNILVVQDTNGNVLKGADIRIYRSIPNERSIKLYSNYFDDIPDTEVTADLNGYANIGDNPFGSGIIHDPFKGANSSIIVRVQHNNKVGYGILESAKFNMEYWRGNSDTSHLILKVKLYDIVPVEKNKVSSLPSELKLYQNYPNPFNPSTRISYEIPKNGDVLITVYDVVGKEVKRLYKNNISAGKHQLSLDMSKYPSGVYILNIQQDQSHKAIKLTLIK